MIYLASDHKGFYLKSEITQWLDEWAMEYNDLGPFEMDDDDDYPDYIAKVGERFQNEPEALAIVLGHSGQGEAMVANKFKGVRAVVFYGGPDEIVTLSKEHNNANVLSIGASFVDVSSLKNLIKLWIETSFSGEERHQRRINKIKDLEQ
jgi:ribose 5-phosphate isomerase B